MANYFNTAANQQFASLPAAAAAASDIRNQFARTDIARASQADSERRTDLAYQTAAEDQAYRREQIEQVRQAAAQDAEAAKQRMDRQQMMDAAQQRLNIKAVIEGEIAKNGTLSPQTFQALQEFLVAEDPDVGGQAQLMQYSPEAVETMIAGFEGNFGAWFAENPVPMPAPEQPELPASVQSLQWRAQEAGLQPGTPEYREFIQTGGKMAEGINLTLPDGTSFQQGNIANMPSGQNPTTTSTPRDGDKLSAKLTESDAAYLSAEREKARAAEDLETLSQNLGMLSKQVGYTGPFGGAYGKLDDAIGILPGDSGARGAFRSQATEAQLTFTERTKGAITEREMALFAGAVPNLNNTKDANEFISKVLSAGARRVQTRHKFMEAYAARRGSLEGAEGAWDAYMNANPMLVESDGQLQLRDEGNWQEYVARDQTVDMTPERLSRMTPQEASMIDVNSLNTEAQIDALMRALGAQ